MVHDLGMSVLLAGIGVDAFAAGKFSYWRTSQGCFMSKWVLSLFLPCAFLQGCIHSGKTVPIGVFDGDSGQPVAGTTVSVNYVGDGFWELFPRTVPIAVFDGDTGEPVSGATVSVSYDNMAYGLDLFQPHDDEK